jgi:hypothetical protein
MKLPGVSGVYDYAGPSRNSRYRSRPCCLPPMQKRQRPDCIFSELNTQPTCTPVYASLNTSRCATQNSGPSGSLLLSRRSLAFPASCRFIPAHCIGDLARTRQTFLLPLHGTRWQQLDLLSKRFLVTGRTPLHVPLLLCSAFFLTDRSVSITAIVFMVSAQIATPFEGEHHEHDTCGDQTGHHPYQHPDR